MSDAGENQKQDQLGHVLGLDVYLQRLVLENPEIVFLALVAKDALLRVGDDRARRYGVDANTVRSKLADKAFGQAEKRFPSIQRGARNRPSARSA